jgi:haloalkane dehalogenase
MTLPDFPWQPRFLELDGLRLARIDEGEGPPVVMWHGEPTWSFLWRKVLPPVRDAGFRVICPDLPGFGRSDKPQDVGWYSYDRHAELAGRLIEALDLRGATFVVHDWGGPVGLRVAVEHADRVDRLVLMDTGLFTGHQKMSEAWSAFRRFVETAEDLPIGNLVDGGCVTDLPPEVVAAYDFPFPTPASKAGARAFPLMIPRAPTDPGAEAGQRVLDALRADARPKLLLWADRDPILPWSVGERFGEVLGVEPVKVEGAGHFLQEDAGPEIGRLIAGWLVP